MKQSISSWSFIYERKEGPTPFSLQISDHNLLLSDVKLTQIMKQLRSQTFPREIRKFSVIFLSVPKGIWLKRREMSWARALGAQAELGELGDN